MNKLIFKQNDYMKSEIEKRAGGAKLFWNLARRNFVFYRTGNALFCAGCAVSAVILAGALLTGASLKESVRGLYGPRLGEVRWALSASPGPFREAIADSIGARLAVKAAPVTQLTGSVSVAGGGGSVHRVNIVGVDDRFWGLGPPPAGKLTGLLRDDRAVVNSALAKKLNVARGDRIVLRFSAAGSPVADAPFGPLDNLATLAVSVREVADGGMFGDFSLRTEHSTVYNVFVPLELLQPANSVSRMATAILIGQPADGPAAVTDELIINAVQENLSVKDAGLNVRSVSARADEPRFPMPHARGRKIAREQFEIYSDRIFISDAFREIIVNAIPEAVPVSSWFVNSINRQDLSTPYSFVSTPPLARPLGSNQIELGEWIARDLNASVGDVVTLTYFVPRPVSGVREDSAVFVVSAIHKLSRDTVSWLDRSLMPPYPGLADAGSCAEWDPSIPVDLSRIRPKDEAYWHAYGGTPKAVIGYGMAERIWGNRFGVCTAVRVPYDGGATSADAVEAAILARLTPSMCGIQLTDVRASVDRAVENGTDFAPLFLGLSFFTFAASLLLIWLLSTLQVKSREEEHSVLAAVGYSRGHILLIYLSEGLITFSIGTAVGVILSPLYTLAVIAALKTVWHAAAMTPELKLRLDLAPVLWGSAAAFVCALVSMMVPVYSLTKSKRAVKAPSIDTDRVLYSARVRAAASLAFILAAPLLLLLTGAARSRSAAVIFFISGTVLLIAMLNLVSALIDVLRHRASIRNTAVKDTLTRAFSMRRLILLNVTREKKRALGAVMALACALYVLGTTQLFHHDAQTGAAARSSGTGGFVWYGELNAGIPRDQAGVKFLRERGVNINAGDARFLSLPMRMRDGDDASCLNLNRAESPVLVGADQALLDSAGAFSFASVIKGVDRGHPWRILGAYAGGKTVYGVADANTIEWGLGKSLGDTLKYIDESGDTLGVILAGGLRNSVLQGKVIIAESDFIRRFPSISGYRLLLLAAPADKEKIIADAFMEYHDKNGLTLESAVDRLNSFNAVENTYLSIFALLGMMGLTLGCFGMGIIVMRGISERRRELALLMAQGFSAVAIKRMLFSEHALVALAGTLAGLLPAVIASGAAVSWTSALRIAALLAIVLSCGFGSILIGLRGLKRWEPLKLLKEEV